MIDTFIKLKGEASKVGLTINENKTKYLYCIRQVSRNVPIFEETKI
jgi:ubiquitin